MTNAEGPVFLNLKNMSPADREAIRALYRKAKGDTYLPQQTITERQMETALAVFQQGGTKSSFVGNSTYSFTKLILKWFSESDSARQSFRNYIKTLNETKKGVTATTQPRFEPVQCKCGKSLGSTNGLNSHVRLTADKSKHGLANAHLLTT